MPFRKSRLPRVGTVRAPLRERVQQRVRSFWLERAHPGYHQRLAHAQEVELRPRKNGAGWANSKPAPKNWHRPNSQRRLQNAQSKRVAQTRPQPRPQPSRSKKLWTAVRDVVPRIPLPQLHLRARGRRWLLRRAHPGYTDGNNLSEWVLTQEQKNNKRRRQQAWAHQVLQQDQQRKKQLQKQMKTWTPEKWQQWALRQKMEQLQEQHQERQKQQWLREERQKLERKKQGRWPSFRR